MAIRLPDALEITDFDEHEPCPFCGHSTAADPDDMDAWADHLIAWHGFDVVEDRPHDDERETPRTIRLKQVGWTGRTKFAPSQRVNVKADSHPRDYAGRRGTVVGRAPDHSDYAVAFDEHPALGVLRADTLEAYVARERP